jgi:geranylgeranyl diphosphate synthase type II
MIKVSAKLGCLAAGVGLESETMKDIETYSENIGYAFQIVDDILDVVGDSALLGKNIGSDKDNNKLTFMSFYTVEEASLLARRLTDEAIAVISKYENSQNLVALAEYLLKRNH